MKYRRLGSTGIKLSEIGLGSWLTYGDAIENKAAIEVIHTAYELGINYFDSANVYANGKAEKVVGEALKIYDRSSFVVATKAFFPMGSGINERGLSRKHIIEQVHESLKRLDMDYIDIFYCHRFDTETPVLETLRVIDDLIRQGKIIYAGVSQWTAAQISEAIGTADRYLMDRIVVNQPVYNMLNRTIEAEIVPTSIKYGISQVVYSPLAQGVLSGKYKKDAPIPQGSRASNPNTANMIQMYLTKENLEKVEKLARIAERIEISMVQIALAWILAQGNITSAIIGASSAGQVIENVKAVDILLTEKIMSEITNILDQ